MCSKFKFVKKTPSFFRKTQHGAPLYYVGDDVEQFKVVCPEYLKKQAVKLQKLQKNVGKKKSMYKEEDPNTDESEEEEAELAAEAQKRQLSEGVAGGEQYVLHSKNGKKMKRAISPSRAHFDDENDEGDVAEDPLPLDFQFGVAAPSDEEEDDYYSAGGTDSDEEIAFINTNNDVTKTRKRKRADKMSLEEAQKAMEESHAYFQMHAHSAKTSNNTLSGLSLLTSKQVADHAGHTNQTTTTVMAKLKKVYSASYPLWEFYRSSGFNLMFYGLGSKKRLLDEFAAKMLVSANVVTVNAYAPNFTISELLKLFSQDLFGEPRGFRNPADHTAFVLQQLDQAVASDSSFSVVLVVHSLDGETLRNTDAIGMLASLAAHPAVSLLTSCDHINAALLWDVSILHALNLIWVHTPTFERYVVETSYEEQVMTQTGELGLRSIQRVLDSLSPNARLVFSIIAQYQLQTEAKTNGIAEQHLLTLCQSKGLLSSMANLNAHLVEYIDHKILTKRREGGSISYLLPGPPELLTTVLQYIKTINDS